MRFFFLLAVLLCSPLSAQIRGFNISFDPRALVVPTTWGNQPAVLVVSGTHGPFPIPRAVPFIRQHNPALLSAGTTVLRPHVRVLALLEECEINSCLSVMNGCDKKAACTPWGRIHHAGWNVYEFNRTLEPVYFQGCATSVTWWWGYCFPPCPGSAPPLSPPCVEDYVPSLAVTLISFTIE